jgi:HEAT repeat protein
MRSRWLIGILIVTAGLVAWVLAFPDTASESLAFLRHEAFFDGKPTNYWIRALKHEGLLGQAQPTGDIGRTLRNGGSAAVAVLCEIAENPDESVRSEALLSLSLIGPEAQAAAPMLTRTIEKEKNSGRFLVASETLAKIDPAAAAQALSSVLLNKKDASRRAWALTELLKLAPKGQEALPVLNELSHDPDEDARLRVQAIRVLWHLKQPAGPLISSLCDILKVDATPAGVQALEVLGEMGPAAKPALPALRMLLEKPTLALVGRRWGPPHRAAVSRTLGMIGPEAHATVPALLASLNNDNYFLRTEVALALAQMGPPAKEALAARDAVWWTSITLLAARPPSNLTAPPLIERMRRTWIPSEAQTHEAVREAVLRIDPNAAARAGVH